MQKHRPFVAVAMACVCMLILSGIAMASSPATPGATPSAQPTPPSVTPGKPQDTSGASDAIQHLGLTQFPNIYVGGVVQPDGSIIVQLGPGDDTDFTNALQALMASSAVETLGPEPAVTIVRMPHNQSDFDAALAALLAKLPQFNAQGFNYSHSEPDIPAGIYDVAFSEAPAGMTPAAATAELQTTVSPMIQVTSVDAAPVQLALDREHDGTDGSDFKGSDYIHGPINGGKITLCTAGFAMIGTLGLPRGSTAAHCNAGGTGNLTFMNGGYRINGYNPAQYPPEYDYTSQLTFGTTSNWQFTNSGADIQLLDTDGDPYAPYIWVGQGTSEPTEMPVGEPYTSAPMVGESLTFHGAFSREHRWMAVISSNSTSCLHETAYPNIYVCHLIQTNINSSRPQWPGPGVQPGDSGGPVFCYACYSNGTVKPAGLIAAFANTGGNEIAWATFIGNDLDAIGGGAHIYTAP